MNKDLEIFDSIPDPMTDLTTEINLLSGRVDLLLRSVTHIIAKIDPGFTDDPFDPETQRKNKLFEQTILTKLKAEALAQVAHDPEQFNRLKRYFKDIP